MLYRLGDIFFVLFHTSLILFNLFGWVWKKTRLANLICLLITGASWTLLGWIVGTPGYCPVTDWHFDILEKLGHTNLPTSYIEYLSERLTGLDFRTEMVDSITLWGLIIALILSVIVNFRHMVQKLLKKC